MEAAISALDSHWVSLFWATNSTRFDHTFSNEKFENFHDPHGVSTLLITAGTQNKSGLESKHKTRRDVFLRICPNSLNETVPAKKAIRIPNDLYGNHLCYSHELEKNSQGH